jgi:hypothetical protein
MPETRRKIEDVLAALKSQRDELALQMHLGKADAKDEWQRLEKAFAALTARMKPVGDVVGETAGEVGSAIELAAEELKKGFDRVRGLLGRG